MLTPSDHLLVFWRRQKANRALTDESVHAMIQAAYARVDTIAKREMTESARDMAAAFMVRLSCQHCEERQSLAELVEMLTGACP